VAVDGAADVADVADISMFYIVIARCVFYADLSVHFYGSATNINPVIRQKYGPAQC